MTSTSPAVRNLEQADLEWVLDLTGARRERILGFAPLFWRPAPNARGLHAKFLTGQIDNPQVLSLRTEHGFVFTAPRGDVLDIDDMALADDNLWDRDSRSLLQAAAAGQTGLRFVCPVPEPARAQAAIDMGMSVGETWWHRDLEPPAQAAALSDRNLDVKSAAGRLLDAPPVYAPGVPVAVISQVADAAALTAIEKRAASFGAPVAVVSQSPGDTELIALLESAGYKRTTDFFTWRP